MFSIFKKNNKNNFKESLAKENIFEKNVILQEPPKGFNNTEIGEKIKKEQLIVIPLKSFNGIEYGTSRDIVWKKLGKPNSSFKKTNTSKVETDDYEKFHIYFDDNYNFEAVEIFKGVNVNYNGDILSNKYSEVLSYFKKIYNDIEEDGFGFTSIAGSIGVYYENNDDLVDSILFGKENYYE